MDSCVFCGSIETLNTEIGIVSDGKQVQVKICDACQDDATPKKIKAAYEEKNKGIQETLKILQAAAAKIGYKVVPINEVAAPAPQAQATPKKQQERPRQPIQKLPPIAQASGAGSTLPEDTNVGVTGKDGQKIRLNSAIEEAQTFQSASRPPTVIPRKIKDDSGETTITVVSIGDGFLQEKFKSEIRAGNEGKLPKGYTTKDCSVCNSSGKLRNGQECPRCKGVGMVTI